MFDNQRPATAAERAALVTFIKDTYFDPYSIRDARISSAVESTGVDGASAPPMICVEANAKNRMGGYVGKSATIFYFGPDGKVARAASAQNSIFVGSFCKDNRLQYTPFKEIEEKT